MHLNKYYIYCIQNEKKKPVITKLELINVSYVKILKQKKIFNKKNIQKHVSFT